MKYEFKIYSPTSISWDKIGIDFFDFDFSALHNFQQMLLQQIDLCGKWSVQSCWIPIAG